ncbi:hypothetical protein [Paraburkholderia sp. SIMBA_054]|uniref:hypothetical protein n=1 Tax=Paraburkholderia sp. SIMBA_054 TaxID=3085795 RepID=UPI00397AADAA
MRGSIFERMISVPSLQPLSPDSQREMDGFFERVRTEVVPIIVKEVTDRERRAVEARKMFIR